MNTTVKNLIGVAAIIATLAFAYASYAYVRVYDRSSEPTNFRSFTVQAEGKVVAVPDVAEFSFDVITEGGNDVAKLQQENSTKMNKALAFVTAQGIDKKDVATQQYNIQPRYQTTVCEYKAGEICPPASIVGYTVQQSAQVKIRDFAKISSLLSGVVNAGANSVSQLQFTIDDPTEVESQAREMAISKAKDKANMIARAGGFSVGRFLSISENFYPGPYMQRESLQSMAMDKAGGAVAPSVEPGSQEVNVQISLQYEIN